MLGRQEREDIRMPLRPGELSRAVAAAPSLSDFHSWVRVDMHDYRTGAGKLRRARIERKLGRLDAVLALHRAGAERLLASEWARPGPGPVQPLFRVPLLVEDRDAARAALAEARVNVGYLYDPPLDDYAGAGFTDPSPAPEAGRWFARHALPVDPLKAELSLRVLAESGARPARSGPGGG